MGPYQRRGVRGFSEVLDIFPQQGDEGDEARVDIYAMVGARIICIAMHQSDVLLTTTGRFLSA